ncbi:hypothetical protein BASA50_009949 [Batrachochytrium salamandrivorans]|uniref:Protection of telomeres protein 1 n=1 Tax=Batrachochytrium salamandrivorans TaxID=1357716 RepID=A0ABQ8EZX9_9FUNG|nr:hypothetical protein BASA62_007554 [Batrachochytrium salamandrivorans]KAH6565260.1 hypothetical protein BASA60_009986 [Batrachochytrium salamandrivorans]KAH6586690.1 hypothetical protein BASA61_006486 [Batrachochytrium salamandrivorans]KAH6589594.1 hypothetical protein BASA50_009949 [Batrachochytrium salamandrivorans]
MQRTLGRPAGNQTTAVSSTDGVESASVTAYKLLLHSAALELQLGKLHAIGDLHAMPVAHVVGVVTGTRPPSKTRGQDYMLSLTLSDMTFAAHALNGVTVNIFKPSEAELPPLPAIGDIVRLSIKVGIFNDRLQGILLRAPRDTCVLFKADQSLKNDAEAEVIRYLRQWWITQLQSPTPPLIKSYGSHRPCVTISDLVPNTFYNLTAQVVSIKSRSPFTVALTDYTTNTSLQPYEGELTEYYPKEIIHKGILECSFWGVALDYVPLEHILHPGDFVWIKNMRCKIGKFGYMEGAANGDRKLNGVNYLKLLPTDQTVQPIQIRARDMDTRRTILTKGLAQLTSIKDILESNIVPAKYRCCVKIVAQMPLDTKDFTRPYCGSCRSTFILDSLDPSVREKKMCPQPMCAQAGPAQHIYMYSLLLSDDTGFLPAIVSGVDAIRFVGGISPCDLVLNPEVLATLQSRLGKLRSGTDNTSNEWAEGGPEFECMIESYTSTQAEGSKVARYKIFNTTLR